MVVFVRVGVADGFAFPIVVVLEARFAFACVARNDLMVAVAARLALSFVVALEAGLALA